MYADYTYYLTYLKGREASIDEASFPYYENQAEMILRERILMPFEVNNQIKDCICELAENILTYSQQGDISSEKVGDYSVSYQKRSAFEQKRSNNDIIKKHLARTGLLYTGVL